MKDTDKRLNQILHLLQKNQRTLEALARAQLASVMKRELRTPALRKLYELTARGASVREIAKKTGIATGSASRIRTRWSELGLMVKDGRDFKTVL
jgi:DNA-binding NarL/FixJ family response regulator